MCSSVCTFQYINDGQERDYMAWPRTGPVPAAPPLRWVPHAEEAVPGDVTGHDIPPRRAAAAQASSKGHSRWHSEVIDSDNSDDMRPCKQRRSRGDYRLEGNMISRRPRGIRSRGLHAPIACGEGDNNATRDRFREPCAGGVACFAHPTIFRRVPI